MGQNLAEITHTRLKIMIPMITTQKLFDAYVGLHILMRKHESIHNKQVDLLQHQLLRKTGIIEAELRRRCITKKITLKRMRGIKIDSREKIRIHSHFSKWLRKYRETEMGKKSFYFKR